MPVGESREPLERDAAPRGSYVAHYTGKALVLLVLAQLFSTST
jgi:hypothetical protein